ncbi:UNC-like C-terminal-domain-containing protein [Cerioporus squamosus]|nr:UNC-like C-terminal-domain-containing protein [Cerioporus squamosus]
MLYLDFVGEPDFALWSAGARIVQELTSRTYTPDAPFWTKLWRPPVTLAQPPELALTPGLQPGCCWPMKGQHGSLGIKLAQEIVPRAITIDHLPGQLSYRNDTAPRLIDVWGALPANFVLLGHIAYDIYGKLPVQTFDLFSDVGTLKLILDTVLLIIKDNWGNQVFTCIYRVRVHGDNSYSDA